MSMMVNCHHCIINISEGSPESCEAFKHNVAGYFYFHTVPHQGDIDYGTRVCRHCWTPS